eukprot:CAMPEP_0172197826 /NCGR_PEP_ID=MMETSP1050-20130122/27713_1 /TAXON_ID=233186 /ORGANISM="Cryptomonas curvata, Strain CCAP979/52" /LENGTH=193 /DNA_ID=CAMNT_0012874511 /DNA_START=55 /DNA_END=632 /DNA_ORIENTATION=+
MTSYSNVLVDTSDTRDGRGPSNFVESMNTTDWRWAAQKGFWDPQRKCWNQSMGGMQAYLAQRNKRRAERIARRERFIADASSSRETADLRDEAVTRQKLSRTDSNGIDAFRSNPRPSSTNTSVNEDKHPSKSNRRCNSPVVLSSSASIFSEFSFARVEHAVATVEDPAASNQPHARNRTDLLAFMIQVQWAPL